MHEFSLVRALLRQVDETAQQYPAQRVVSIRVQIGEFSGVDPELLLSAFRMEAADGPLCDADLVVDRTELRAVCEACAAEFRILEFKFVCPSCGSARLKILGGEEMMLASITMEDSST